MRQLRRLLVVALLSAALPPGIAAQVTQVGTAADSSGEALRALQIVEGDISLNGRFVRGDASVAAGDTVRGPLVAVGGNAEVYGTVLGNVTAVFGDVTIHDGADVRGSATAYRGRVIVEGGRVRGALRATPVASARQEAAPMSRAEALKLAGGWLAVLAVIGLAALVLLGGNVDATARALADDFGRAFLVGVAGQLGFLPLMLLLVAVLAVTLLGILLIPFALVAAPVAFAGLVTLGWLGMALMIGRGLGGTSSAEDRAGMIRSLTIGIVLLMAPWLVAALLQGGTGALLARVVAIGVTWVAATAGLGAALLSRAGSGASAGRRQPPAPPAGGGWQTPTPVAGVAAARRPVPARPTPTP